MKMSSVRGFLIFGITVLVVSGCAKIDQPGNPSGVGSPSTSAAKHRGSVTIGIFRPTITTFALRNSLTSGFGEVSVTFGQEGDIPLAGDWDGNGTTTVGVCRPGDST